MKIKERMTTCFEEEYLPINGVLGGREFVLSLYIFSEVPVFVAQIHQSRNQPTYEPQHFVQTVLPSFSPRTRTPIHA